MSRTWSREEIIEAIQLWANIYGEPPTAYDWNPARARQLGDEERARRFEQGLWPYPFTVRRVFGGWAEAIRAAGFLPPLRGGGSRRHATIAQEPFSRRGGQ